MANVLVIDDAESAGDSLAIFLSAGRHRVHLAGDVAVARQVLRVQQVDVVVVGALLEPLECREFLEHLRCVLPGTALIILESALAAPWRSKVDDRWYRVPRPISAATLLAIVDEATS